MGSRSGASLWACVLRAHNMSFLAKTLLLRFVCSANRALPLHPFPLLAIYHFQAQRIARGSGRNAVRAAAYRHREQMRDELTGERYAYTGHREELVHSEMALPDATPQWLRTLVDGRTPAQASAALRRARRCGTRCRRRPRGRMRFMRERSSSGFRLS